METATVVERDFNQLSLLFNLVISDMKVSIRLEIFYSPSLLRGGVSIASDRRGKIDLELAKV